MAFLHCGGGGGSFLSGQRQARIGVGIRCAQTRGRASVGVRVQTAVPVRACSDTTSAIRGYISRLQCGEDLGYEGGEAIRVLIDGLKEGVVEDSLVGGMLTLMPPDKVSADALGSIAKILRERMVRSTLEGRLLDIVGTGGDGLNTVNISSAAAIVAAAAGCRVAKSGNRSATSKAGSADVLEKLGVNLGDGNDQLTKLCMEHAGISFLFARNHHPILGAVARVRRELGIRTVFNVLGPLVHPVPAGRIVLGVYDSLLLAPMAQALANLGVERALVVHCAGLDELCAADDALVAEVIDGTVMGGIRSIDTRIDGITRCSVNDLIGGDAEHNAKVIRGVFDGEESPITDAIVLNAGAGCFVYGLDKSLEDGVRRARHAITSGAAKDTLEKWAQVTSNSSVGVV